MSQKDAYSTPEERIALALTCLQPVYRAVARAEARRRWWRRPSGPAIGTLILAERVRRALTEDTNTESAYRPPASDKAE